MSIDFINGEIAFRIKKIREDAGLSQTRFAELVNLESQSHVSKIENGENQPSNALISAISSIFDVTTDYILKGIVSTGKNKFYVGYNIEMNNNLGKEALKYLQKCIKAIQELDAISSAKISTLENEIEKSRIKIIAFEKKNAANKMEEVELQDSEASTD